MTVLRSRKVLPKVNVVIEPMTPFKSPESTTQLSENSTPISGSSAAELVGSKSEFSPVNKSVNVMETGRRRSARLAKLVGVNGSVDSKVVSVKRGKSSAVRSLEVGVDFENVSDVGIDTSVADKAEVTGGSKSVGSGKQKQQLIVEVTGLDEEGLDDVDFDNVDDVGIDKSGTDNDKDGVTGGENVVEFGMKRFSKSVGSGKQKRKLRVEVMSLQRGSGGKVFRSGKRVVERRMEGGNDSDDGLSPKAESFKVTDVDEDGNDGNKKRRISRADKGKGIAVYVDSGTSSTDSDESVYGRLAVTDDDSDSDGSYLLKSSAVKPLVIDEGSTRVESRRGARRKFTRQEKGKMKVGDEDSSPSNHNKEHSVEMPIADSIVSDQSVAGTAPEGTILVTENGAAILNVDGEADRERDRTNQRRRFRGIARRIASRFARFTPQDELELANEVPGLSAEEVPPLEPEDWPGPFSTAMKIIKDRELNTNGKQPFTSVGKGEGADIKWVPSKQEQEKRPTLLVPSLQDLCLSVLSKHVDSITSLDYVPDVLRHKLCWAFCDSRRMNSYFLELLLQGTPTEIRLRECSWLSEQLFVKAFEGCNTDKLTVLQFDLGGVCLPDYNLSCTLTRSPNSLPALTTLSLKGAYRLTDEGIRMLVSSAPNLKSIDLSQCSMLTSDGICCLLESLRLVLRELYLDNCQGVDAKLILPVLLKLESLEVLSLAGIDTVSDDFVCKFLTVHGCRMKEIVLADCMELTNSALKAIGDNCPGLHALDLANLCKLTDVGLCHLANGCQEIQMLKLCRSKLSDEAVAAYLDIRGAALKELSLNNITKVSNNTALSLSRNGRNLQTLDLSWCRNLTNEALGLIVDSCSSLEVVKLFGCTQVTSVFLDGYSNPRVKIIGLKLTSVVQYIDVPDFLQGPSRYASST